MNGDNGKIYGPVNGTPQPHKISLDGMPPAPPPGGGNGGDGGNKGGSGCLIALVTLALVGGGWLHMVATSVGWAA